MHDYINSFYNNRQILDKQNLKDVPYNTCMKRHDSKHLFCHILQIEWNGTQQNNWITDINVQEKYLTGLILLEKEKAWEIIIDGNWLIYKCENFASCLVLSVPVIDRCRTKLCFAHRWLTVNVCTLYIGKLLKTEGKKKSYFLLIDLYICIIFPCFAFFQ